MATSPRPCGARAQRRGRAPALLAPRPPSTHPRRLRVGRMEHVVSSNDPVVVRRAQIARWVGLAKRIGYGLLLVAVVAFIVAAVAGFPSAVVTVTVVALVA